MYNFKKAGLSIFRKMVTMSSFKPQQTRKMLLSSCRKIASKPRQMSKTSEHLDTFVTNKEPLIGVQNYYESGKKLSRTERELVNYLTKEVQLERKAQKIKIFPMSLNGFSIKFRGSEIELNKHKSDHEIFVKINVANTVDTYGGPDNEQHDGKPIEIAEMRSKPRFEVDFIKGNDTLSFNCSFIKGAINNQECDYNDIFNINEICLFEGRHTDHVYTINGDVLDDNFYDLLMNFLEEKGISNEFARKLSDLATAYEHSMYIQLLENLAKFTREEKS